MVKQKAGKKVYKYLQSGFTCDEETLAIIKRLRVRCGSTTSGEPIRRALRFFDMATAPGVSILLVDKEGATSKITLI